MFEPLTFPPHPGPPCTFGPSTELEYDAALASALRAAVWVTPPQLKTVASGTATPHCLWELLGVAEAGTWVVPLADTKLGWNEDFGVLLERVGYIRGYGRCARPSPVINRPTAVISTLAPYDEPDT
jgi:hypothetical protein